MKIKPLNLFHTPENWEEIHRWIESHCREERSHIMIGSVMAWNLACKFVNEDEGDDA